MGVEPRCFVVALTLIRFEYDFVPPEIEIARLISRLGVFFCLCVESWIYVCVAMLVWFTLALRCRQGITSAAQNLGFLHSELDFCLHT